MDRPLVGRSGWRAGARPAGGRSVLERAATSGRRRSARRQAAGAARQDGRRRRLVTPGQAIAVWVGLAILLALDRRLAPALELTRADFGTSPVGAIVSVIGAFAGLFRGGSSSSTFGLLVGMRDVVTGIGRGIAEFARDVGVVFASVWAFIRKFWTRVLRPMLERLDGYITRIAKWLRDTFGPVIEFLQGVRNWILKFYAKWLGPIFDTIDIFRRILSIFSLFGLEWSRKLDAKLAELEDVLRRPIELALREINKVIGIIDRIVTLDGLLQRLTLIRSIGRDVRYVFNTLHNSRSNPLTESERLRLRDQNAPPTSEEIFRRVDAGIRDEGPGMWTPAERREFDDLVLHVQR